MNPRFKTVLPALVVLVAGMAVLAYVNRWEARLVAEAESRPTVAGNEAATPPVDRPATPRPTSPPVEAPRGDPRAASVPPPSGAGAVPGESSRPPGAGPTEVPDGTGRVRSSPAVGRAPREPSRSGVAALPGDVTITLPGVPSGSAAVRRADGSSRAGAGPAASAGFSAGTAATGSAGTLPGAGQASSGSAVADDADPAPDTDDPDLGPPDTDPPVDDTDPFDDDRNDGDPDTGDDDGGDNDPTGPSRVMLLPTPATVSLGDAVAVSVVIEAATEVGHVPFHLNFDPEVLEFLHGDEGGFLRSDGAPTAFFAARSGGGSKVVVGLSRLGQVGGVSGAGDLCVLHFRTIGPGNTVLTFSRAKVRDPSNRIVPSNFVPAAVVVR